MLAFFEDVAQPFAPTTGFAFNLIPFGPRPSSVSPGVSQRWTPLTQPRPQPRGSGTDEERKTGIDERLRQASTDFWVNNVFA
jgi:hypothetical protein